MPRFYFKVCEGDISQKANGGFDLPDIETARREASKALAEMMQDSLPHPLNHTTEIEVRDENHKKLFTARLTFEIDDRA